MANRITVPEDYKALILSSMQMAELYELAKGIRQRGARYIRDNASPIHAICGEIMLAIAEQQE